MPAIERVQLIGEQEIRKALRSKEIKNVYASALMAEDIYYVKVSKAEAIYQMREHGADSLAPIAWYLLGESIYIEPNRDRS